MILNAVQHGTSLFIQVHLGQCEYIVGLPFLFPAAAAPLAGGLA
jgi:hypothetical protein